jgi:hypothetical protein
MARLSSLPLIEADSDPSSHIIHETMLLSSSAVLFNSFRLQFLAHAT